MFNLILVERNARTTRSPLVEALTVGSFSCIMQIMLLRLVVIDQAIE